jgi:hypothetical protein
LEVKPCLLHEWLARRNHIMVCRGCNRSLLKPILSCASTKMMSSDEPLSTKSFPKVQLAMLAFIIKASLWGKPWNLTSSSEKMIGIWDHLVLSTLPSMQMFRLSRK